MPQGSARLEPLLRDVSVLGRCHRAHKETVALTSSGVGRGGFTIARWGPNSYDILAGGDWNHGILWLSIYYWECHHPNWRTPWFFRGIETTNQYRYIECSKNSNDLVAHGGPWWPMVAQRGCEQESGTWSSQNSWRAASMVQDVFPGTFAKPLPRYLHEFPQNSFEARWVWPWWIPGSATELDKYEGIRSLMSNQMIIPS